MNMTKAVLLSLVLFGVVGCSNLGAKTPVPLHESPNYYNFLQPSFADYLAVTGQWLSENRGFISDAHETEIAMNMPFEAGNKETADKAILLVHGLSDSPYSFSDIAISLQKQGFYVQTLLLPGHGSKPQDLMLPSYFDWQGIVDHYADLLKQDFEQVWLGGYSTGANLVTIHTIQNTGVDGLMLFSPGFQSNVPVIEKFARVVSVFVDGYEREETNLAKYSSASMNGAIAYSDSAAMVRELLEDNTVTVPTLIAISEYDSAVDSSFVKSAYLKHFNNPKNKLVWYGNSDTSHNPDKRHNSVQALSMQLDEARISTGSHMSTLYAPDNPYYGAAGEFRKCSIKFKKQTPSRCNNKEEIWYAAWGYKEEGKRHGKLTWNPYYSELEQEMFSIAR